MRKRQALIINIVTIKTEDPRIGSPEDAIKLEETLQELGYKVNIKENLLGANIIPAIRECAKKNCDSFICCTDCTDSWE